MERTRDLFEQALDGCPAKYCKALYLMYGKLEEEYGLGKRAMKVYERATEAVSDEDKFEVNPQIIPHPPDNTDHPSFSDVHHLYRQSNIHLRSSRYSSHL